MGYGYQIEKEKIQKEDRRGIWFVISGALASVLLWFTVSVTGNPIASAGSYSEAYLFLVPTPAILVTVLAFYRVRKKRIY